MSPYRITAVITTFILLSYATGFSADSWVQKVGEEPLIRAVQQALKGQGLDPTEFDYSVVSHFQLTESERAILESNKIDHEIISKITVFAQVAVISQQDRMLQSVYNVQSTPAGGLTASRQHRVEEDHLTLDEFLNVRRAAQEIAQEFMRTRNVSSLADHFFVPEFFDNPKQVAESLPLMPPSDRSSGEPEIVHLLEQVSKERRRQFLAVSWNIVLRMTEFLLSRRIVGVDSPSADDMWVNHQIEDFIRQSGLPYSMEQLNRFLKEPPTTKQELENRLLILGVVDQAFSTYVRRVDVYSSPWYQINTRRFRNRILNVMRFERGHIAKPPLYATNIDAFFELYFIDTNGQMKAVGLSPVVY